MTTTTAPEKHKETASVRVTKDAFGENVRRGARDGEAFSAVIRRDLERYYTLMEQGSTEWNDWDVRTARDVLLLNPGVHSSPELLPAATLDFGHRAKSTEIAQLAERLQAATPVQVFALLNAAERA